MEWEMVIGLEIHAQLATKTKITRLYCVRRRAKHTGVCY